MFRYNMLHRKDYVCFLDLKRADWPSPYDYNYKPSHFADDHHTQLPVLMKVTDGYYGTNSINFTYSSEDVYLITHILTQKRIIIKDRTGQLLSFPDDHPMRFFAVVNGKQDDSARPLGEIVNQYAMSAAKVEVKPESGKAISFCSGAGDKHNMVMDIFDWETTYEERYLVGNSVAYEKMGTTPAVIPIWMPISLTAALGFKDGTFEEYKKFMDEMKEATASFTNAQAKGVKEIMLFQGKLSDYAESTYDTIAPFDYGSIAQFKRTSTLTKPAPKPRMPMRSISAVGVHPSPKPAPPLPGETKTKSKFNFFKKSKSADSHPDQSYQQTVVQRDNQVQMYTELTRSLHEHVENVYSDETMHENPVRPLPEIPHNEKRKEKNQSRSEKIKPAYEPVDIEKTVPTVSPPSSATLQQKEVRPPPPKPQPVESIYSDYSELPQRIDGMSVSEIANCLGILKMTRHIDSFREADVDGDLLCSLTKDILIEDFNFTEFEVTKLLKFQKGWRPKTV